MKNALKRSVAASAVLAALAGGGLSAAPVATAAPGATLVRANVFFHTNNEDKDHDTNVLVIVRDGNGTDSAFIQNDFGHFNDNSNAGPFTMELRNPGLWQSIRSGTTLIRIGPNGNDTWRFNMHVDLLFSDGSHLVTDANGIELDEDRNQQTFGIH
ncbi:hypothetical protein [Actinomadura rubrisoli]|uniref:PLAT domain-containing protein n=1 Tax=Actinomadura rubrisoli TaxID=2530368 RepID=A0A4V2YV93_9ACTN|nr:hypothetical protein [Actinomadura rubrisoli]TDD80577.1 hypothetical protein E1298_25530 [Actinomadura rubrisoli]